MANDLISRQAAIDVLSQYPFEKVVNCLSILEELPSAQPDTWMERNRERILEAGMEGREVEFRIGGRLFAIREKAQ